jgi:hypothetical protein
VFLVRKKEEKREKERKREENRAKKVNRNVKKKIRNRERRVEVERKSHAVIFFYLNWTLNKKTSVFYKNLKFNSTTFFIFIRGHRAFFTF